jgi:hypothetical protein
MLRLAKVSEGEVDVCDGNVYVMRKLVSRSANLVVV